jgi:ectoine hydroxylase-related dioxygenase (phytanoyl-CoA dioxygenase family)
MSISFSPPPLSFETDGVEIRRAVLAADMIAAVRAEVSVDNEILRRTGIRNLEKKFPCIARIANSSEVRSIARSLLGREPHLVRALFFDKTPDRNWFVAWHQDRTVTLNRRFDLDGWSLWSEKDGVHHVQPPRVVLDQMVTIRLHVDPADEMSGCLSVIPGSHRLGILGRKAIETTIAGSKVCSCIVDAGDAVVMHPLILHASMKSQKQSHRRVVHLEYSSYELPPGVTWT